MIDNRANNENEQRCQQLRSMNDSATTFKPKLNDEQIHDVLIDVHEVFQEHFLIGSDICGVFVELRRIYSEHGADFNILEKMEGKQIVDNLGQLLNKAKLSVESKRLICNLIAPNLDLYLLN